MAFRSWFGALVITGLALAPSAAMAQATKVDDSTLDSRIEARIKASATLKHADIDVSVENSVVTLKGKVPSAAHRTRAGSLAKIAGVTRVDNQIEVDTTLAHKADKAMDKAEDKADKAADKSKNAGEKTKDAAVKAGEKTKDAVGTAGAKTKDVAGDVADAVTDAWIITKLKADFVNEDTLKGSDINVDSDNHVVTLKGTVVTAAGRARANQIAKTTKGVSRVIDALTIGPKK